MSRSIIVDASVALKWMIDEEHHLDARGFVPLAERFMAPEIMLAEVANVLRRKVRHGEIGRPQAGAALDGIKRIIPAFAPMAASARRALTLAIELDHHAYDCAYLALTELVGGVLVTADRALIRKLDAAGVAIDVRAIDDPTLPTRLAAEG